ncbi:MAG: hypothetical protein C4575_10375 [Desulforudis sp.]|jgi:hypothetical protein|nr:MAG: hypothetical protein C4575_10375 [Desulforudis sp.]
MQRDAKILLDVLGKLKAEHDSHWREHNAPLPNVVPKALGFIHARAAWDIEYAKRLVFDFFKAEGALSRDNTREDILDAVQVCLTNLHDNLDDPFMPTSKDWKLIEEAASL